MKKYTKLPRGMTWERVREISKERKKKETFIDRLKNGNDEYVKFRHNGTSFTINCTQTRDFHVTYG